MRIAFTKNNSVLSQLIRWVFDEPCSHVVFIFDDKFVIHSNLLGFQFDWFKTFKKKNQIVESLYFETSLAQEEELYQAILEKYDESNYDFKAFWYFAYRALLAKLFNIQLPSTNPFNNRGLLCTEVYHSLPEWLAPQVKKDLSIITPFTLLMELRNVAQN